MINLKITMMNGKEYNFRNIANNVKEFISNGLAPYGTFLVWYEVFPGININVDNIIEIRELSDEEMDAIKNPKPLGPEPVDENPEIVEGEVVHPDEIQNKEIEETDSDDSD